MSSDEFEILAGGCLCGGIRYQITGPSRDIINCHCANCRRTHGHIAAYTAVQRSDLVFDSQHTLQWYHDETPDTYRGFCNQCGASLFWDAHDGRDKLSVSAGSLDDSGKLKTIGNIYVSEAGKYYQIDDGLPRFETGSFGALDSDESG